MNFLKILDAAVKAGELDDGTRTYVAGLFTGSREYARANTPCDEEPGPWRMEKVNDLPQSFSVEIFCGPKRVFIRTVEGGSHRINDSIEEACAAGYDLVNALNEFGAFPPRVP